MIGTYSAALKSWTRKGLLALALLSPAAATPLPVCAAPAAHSLDTCIKTCGFSIEHVDKAVWATQIQAAEGSTQKVILASSDDMLVVFAIPVEKKQLASHPELVSQVSAFNEQFDLVKVFVDKDGDLSVRVDCHLRILDPKELKDLISQVANVAEQVQKKAR
jgi:Putative bacterial sensory transduction regulator